MDPEEELVRHELTRSKKINVTRETRKIKRQSGKMYVTSAGRDVAAKSFQVITKCCQEKCFTRLSLDDEKHLFKHFYLQSKPQQDSLLAQCMKKLNVDRKRLKNNPKVLRACTWEYFVSQNGDRIKSCRTMIQKLFQVSVKRIRVVQKKVIEGDSFIEKRGTHANRPHKLDSNIHDLLKSHLETIPSKKSHYSQHKSELKYFENPELNIKKLYELFIEYYKGKAGTNLKMKYKTYFQYFKSLRSYSFRNPKTDVCDFCTECKQKLSINPNDPCATSYHLHSVKIKRHLAMRRDLIERSKTDNSFLVIEFDYGQNLPVPKLNVTVQFYKRLLWCYLFNVHVHNDGSSYMYTFMEGQGKKGADSVISFVYDCLCKKMKGEVTEIVFLSDACGGQNKNISMVKFGMWLAKKFNVNIRHIFPVRGHSFNQCDRNFGLVKSSLKKKEYIGTAKPYLEAIVHCRQNPSPFNVVMDRTLIKNWTESLEELFLKKPKTKGLVFNIQQYVQMKYKKDGSLACSKTYTENYTPFTIWKGRNLNTNIALQTVSVVGIKPAKEKDVRDLFSFLSQEDEQWIRWILEEVSV